MTACKGKDAPQAPAKRRPAPRAQQREPAADDVDELVLRVRRDVLVSAEGPGEAIADYLLTIAQEKGPLGRFRLERVEE